VSNRLPAYLPRTPYPLIAVVSSAIVILVGCSEEKEAEPPTPSATATLESASPTAYVSPSASATPEPTRITGSPSADFEQFRVFAAEIDVAIASGNAEFFAARGVEMEVTCKGDEQLGQCTNQPAGTIIRGIPGAAWRSDAGALIPRAEYGPFVSEWFTSALPNESDKYGGGSPRLLALAESSAGEQRAIASLIRDAGASSIQRQCRVFRFSLVDGSWVLSGEYFCYATQTSEDWLSGQCSQCYAYWESWEGS
jgi:hypothetical protein